MTRTLLRRALAALAATAFVIAPAGAAGALPPPDGLDDPLDPLEQTVDGTTATADAAVHVVVGGSDGTVEPAPAPAPDLEPSPEPVPLPAPNPAPETPEPTPLPAPVVDAAVDADADVVVTDDPAVTGDVCADIAVNAARPDGCEPAAHPTGDAEPDGTAAFAALVERVERAVCAALTSVLGTTTPICGAIVGEPVTATADACAGISIGGTGDPCGPAGTSDDNPHAGDTAAVTSQADAATTGPAEATADACIDIAIGGTTSPCATPDTGSTDTGSTDTGDEAPPDGAAGTDDTTVAADACAALAVGAATSPCPATDEAASDRTGSDPDDPAAEAVACVELAAGTPGDGTCDTAPDDTGQNAPDGEPLAPITEPVTDLVTEVLNATAGPGDSFPQTPELPTAPTVPTTPAPTTPGPDTVDNGTSDPTGPTDADTTGEASLRAAGTGGPRSLALTGIDAGILAAIGAALIAAGVAVHAATRRR